MKSAERRLERLQTTRTNAEDAERRRRERITKKIAAGQALSAMEAAVLIQPSKAKGVGRPEVSAYFHRWLAVHYAFLRQIRTRNAAKTVSRAWDVSTKAVEKYVTKYKEEPQAKTLLAVLIDDEDRERSLKHLKMYAELFVDLGR